MATNSGPLTEVLHSEKHSKLSAEEVAKAVARHNKNHSAAKAENAAAKTNKTKKSMKSKYKINKTPLLFKIASSDAHCLTADFLINGGQISINCGLADF